MPRRHPPWDYPRETIPTRYTLQRWRRRAHKLAQQKGALTACGICKRPLRSYGKLSIRHPRSYGNSRHRKICRVCAELLLTLVDVLEWFGASDELPIEQYHDVPDGDLTRV